MASLRLSLPHRPFCIPSLPCASVRRRDPFCKVFEIREQAPTIASSCKNIAESPPRTSMRCGVSTKASFSPFPNLNSRLEELHSSICPNLVMIMTEFMAPNEIYESKDIFTGTCFDPTLVVTSAYAVGRIFAVPNPKGVSPLYKAFMGRICFSASCNSTKVKLTLLAVSFSSDVAVLKVEEGSSPMHVFPLAAEPRPEIDSILISESYWYDQVSIANVLEVRRKSIRAKAPWPLDDQAAWIEMSLHHEPPPVTNVYFQIRDQKNISGSISMRGSPWFNLDGDLVGVASWVVRYNSASSSVGYAAPVSVIRHVVDYAKAKGPHDPVVMDRWIIMQ